MQFAFSVVFLVIASAQADSHSSQKDIVDTAVAANFTILAEALTKADLVTTLKGTGPFTVFAPTDAAFAAALTTLGITKAELLARADLAAILTYHVVSGSVKSSDLSDGMTAATVQGSSITITISEGTVKVNTATVTSADVNCTNGLIHIIDQVLLPPADTSPAPEPAPAPAPAPEPSPAPAGDLKDIVDTAVAAGSFTVLAEALTKAELITTMKGAGPFTVFAPTDAAFAKALETMGATKEELLANEGLAGILTYHVVSGLVKSTDLTNGMEAATVNGAKLTITLDGSTVKVNTATVATADIMCSNGVIHVIDEVLMPPAEGPAPAPAASTTQAASDVSTAYIQSSLISFMLAGFLACFPVA
eukprot:gnl/MRDRNA2_/MRDRNA2_83647_c0_seq1.p1 gnl/MRDRNA2_/MRDRNA2_83647_c0~~gnl/MRDRNA2_/MRDRNA2_83647_c0_seq1.p1  ORF type:complete len:363 (-),score=86.77 gnl/MRDRNA2_/MRDRNA2_83647_c0_seq1:307-1395(-)